MTADGKIIKKAKGVNSDSISKEDYENMYYQNKDTTATKTISKTDFSEGTVNIYSKIAKIQSNSYKKRTKIFNDCGLWIDTEPLILNNLNSKDFTNVAIFLISFL